MTRTRWTRIKCDRCGIVREEEAVSTDFLAEQAAREGWRIEEDRDDGRDLCPDCAGSEGRP